MGTSLQLLVDPYPVFSVNPCPIREHSGWMAFLLSDVFEILSGDLLFHRPVMICCFLVKELQF